MLWNCPVSIHSLSIYFLARNAPCIACVTVVSRMLCSNIKSRAISTDSKEAAVKLHVHLLKDGHIGCTYASNYLLALYARSNVTLHYAGRLFDDMRHRDTRTWTTLISNYAKRGHFQTALQLFRSMQSAGLSPNNFTLASISSCCSNLCELTAGKEIHGWALKNGDCLDVTLENAILDVYIKCKAVELAATMFKLMKSNDTSTWNIMISGFISAERVDLSQELFDSLMVKDVVTWNAMIGGMMRHGLQREALEMLFKMVEDGTELNHITLSIAANLASWAGDLLLGKQIHAYAAKLILNEDDFLNNSLIDMYSKCGKMESAYVLSQRHPKKALWSSIVDGYLRNNDFESGLQSLRLMMEAQVHLDEFTLSSIVSACARKGYLMLGEQIHCVAVKTRGQFDAHMSSSLIDMYAKSGCLEEARRIFNDCKTTRNVILFTAIICGCAFNGEAKEAIELFELMKRDKISPNEVTFLGVLTACSHAGMAGKCVKYLEEMQRERGIKPGIDHYTCVVDAYGRSGRLNEAKSFIIERNLRDFAPVWKSLLTYCWLYKDDKVEKWVFKNMKKFDHYKAPGVSWVHFQDPFVVSR